MARAACLPAATLTRCLAAALLAALVAACAGGSDGSVPFVQISSDPFANSDGQHETAVEPDIAVDGETIVAAFQVGRRRSAGATAIGWAASRDGGRSWERGVVPLLTVHNSPPGAADFASDPAVAHDSVHRTWLVAALAVREHAQTAATSIVVSRSRDGRRWSRPIRVGNESRSGLGHDKPWLTCAGGRCYLAWSGRFGPGPRQAGLAVATSQDGGRTWRHGSGAGDRPGVGYLPVVRPDGSVVVPYSAPGQGIFAHRSTDAGRSFAPSQFIASLWARSPARNIRGLTLPAADAAADGRLFVAWHDCTSPACTANDLFASASTDAASWSPPTRVATGDVARLNEFLPVVAVQDDKVAVFFYATRPRGCTSACRVEPYLVTSRDRGRTWDRPRRLAAPRRLSAFPEAAPGVRFLGDYNAAAFVGDRVLVVFAWAKTPRGGRYDQGIYATLVPFDA